MTHLFPSMKYGQHHLCTLPQEPFCGLKYTESNWFITFPKIYILFINSHAKKRRAWFLKKFKKLN